MLHQGFSFLPLLETSGKFSPLFANRRRWAGEVQSLARCPSSNIHSDGESVSGATSAFDQRVAIRVADRFARRGWARLNRTQRTIRLRSRARGSDPQLADRAPWAAGR